MGPSARVELHDADAPGLRRVGHPGARRPPATEGRRGGGPDGASLATLTVLGSQIGQYVARRHAEQEVRARESRLRAMLETALDAVVSMDADGRVTGWNHAATTIFGYGEDEALGARNA